MRRNLDNLNILATHTPEHFSQKSICATLSRQNTAEFPPPYLSIYILSNSKFWINCQVYQSLDSVTDLFNIFANLSGTQPAFDLQIKSDSIYYKEIKHVQ